jgi:gluconokinase
MASKQRNEWFLGIDLGTGSCKSVVIDAAGRVLGSDASDYAADRSPSKWNAPDPETLVGGMVQSARHAIARAGVLPQHCRAMSLGGALHSVIAIDRSGAPLTPVLTWIDARAHRQASAVRDTADAHRIYRRTGCPVHSMYPLFKVIWLRENRPDVFKKTVRFVSAKEYVIRHLTGQWVADYGIASGSGLLNVHRLKWESEALALAGIKARQLSVLDSPWHRLSAVNADLTSQMGIPAGTPLVLGSSDAVNSSLGAGAVLPQVATCMVGTSGAFRIVSPDVVLDASERSWCYAIDDRHWLVGGAINNGGIVLSWFRDILNNVIASGDANAGLTFDDLIRLAGQVDAGSDGLICLPFLAGERSPNWNMNTRGVFFGLTLNHDLRHMARALLEGVAFRLRSIAGVLNELGFDMGEIRASGGLTRSGLWPQIIASALDLELVIPHWGETSGMGAAMWAMLGTGAIGSLEDARDLIRCGRSFRPIAAEAERYRQLFELYSELYAAMQTSFDRIARLD